MKQREADQLKSDRRQQMDPFASSGIKKSMKTRPQSLGVYGDLQVFQRIGFASVVHELIRISEPLE